MARPKGMTEEDLRSPADDSAEPVEVPDPLAGWRWEDDKPGPSSTLKPEMIPVIARAVASGASKREAAADAGTTEDCLGAWLKRGEEAVRKRKRSPYTRLLRAYEKAEAHYQRFLRELGHRTVVDKKANPRFLTWALAVRDPKRFTVPKETAAAQKSNGLGPAFELVTPEAAATSLEEKLRKFIGLEDEREALFASIQAEVEQGGPTPPAAGGSSA